MTGWLEKNKDPVNDTVVDIMKRSTSSLLVHIWRDHPGQTFPESEETKGGGSKKKKGTGVLIMNSASLIDTITWAGGKTVSSVFLVDLAALMSTLNDTDPHFVRY